MIAHAWRACYQQWYQGSNPCLSVVSTLSEKPSSPDGRWFFTTSRKETTDSGEAPSEPESSLANKIETVRLYSHQYLADIS